MSGFMLSCPMFDDISQMKLENCERFGWMVCIFIAMCKKANLRSIGHKMATVPTGRSRHIKGLVKSNPATMVTKQTPYSYIGPLV